MVRFLTTCSSVRQQGRGRSLSLHPSGTGRGSVHAKADTVRMGRSGIRWPEKAEGEALLHRAGQSTTRMLCFADIRACCVMVAYVCE